MSGACDNCEKAEDADTHGYWCVYRADCAGCKARSIARGMQAFNALDARGSGDKAPLRELTKLVLCDLPETEARALVWRWWQIDHR